MKKVVRTGIDRHDVRVTVEYVSEIDQIKWTAKATPVEPVDGCTSFCKDGMQFTFKGRLTEDL